MPAFWMIDGRGGQELRGKAEEPQKWGFLSFLRLMKSSGTGGLPFLRQGAGYHLAEEISRRGMLRVCLISVQVVERRKRQATLMGIQLARKIQ